MHILHELVYCDVSVALARILFMLIYITDTQIINSVMDYSRKTQTNIS